PDHADSNYRMTREALLDHVRIPAANVHRMQGEIDPSQAANAYEYELRAFFGTAQPRFDLVMLGMGDDGHTASLFPGTAALDEEIRAVTANYVDKLHTWRITLTQTAINHAAAITFLVAGESKAVILREVINGPYQPEIYPSQLIDPVEGQLIWLVDDAAAALL
ncbi:MAG: 6-phosphogluconolactonase, partial [Chitinophagaceae bacterium]|nr:6-phosphogluconolactonase [Anaerolineae bacterium]